MEGRRGATTLGLGSRTGLDCCFIGDVVTERDPCESGEAAPITTTSTTGESSASGPRVLTVPSDAARQVAAAVMVSMATSKARGAASPGVVAWLVSVS